MPDMQSNSMEVTYRRRGKREVNSYLTRFIRRMRSQPGGFVVTGHRTGPSTLELGGEILVTSTRGNRSVSARFAELRADDRWKAAAVLRPGFVSDREGEEMVTMTVESFAWLLDRVIASDPAHYLRKIKSVKDRDE